MNKRLKKKLNYRKYKKYNRYRLNNLIILLQEHFNDIDWDSTKDINCIIIRFSRNSYKYASFICLSKENDITNNIQLLYGVFGNPKFNIAQLNMTNKERYKK